MNGLSPETVAVAMAGAFIAAMGFALLLTVKALRDYSVAGPQLPADIVAHYRPYALWSVARLTVWTFLVALFWSTVGVLAYLYLSQLLFLPTHGLLAVGAAVVGVGAATVIQFLRFLLHCPAVIAASSHYRMSRFYPLWQRLSPALLRNVDTVLLLLGAALIAATLIRLALHQEWPTALGLAAMTLLLATVALTAAWSREARPVAGKAGSKEQPNILLIGSDTLRADRLGTAGYHRQLTPTLDALAARGTWFENCYVPCGRTAPSLVSLLTGTWPQTHRIRDNFVSDAESRLTVPGLPRLLSTRGYRTAAVSDWCGADLGKFDFGFQETDLPADNWNVRFLLRQGPKDLRLFLSLFLRNRLGKHLLPEIYYVGGVPLTNAMGRDSRSMLSRLAKNERPFLLNAFFSTTHPPFGSEYPYYTRFSDAHYNGESKFVMARLTDPFEIIRRQGEPRKEFDLDQILDLYDGCVTRFDDEVARLLEHLNACGLADKTIVVVYSDHGMEFFEHDTWGQGNSVLGDHSARIPLIIADPRKAGGHRIPNVVRTVDLAPTLLELTGQPYPPDMEGISLARCLEGAAPPELPAYNESGIWLTDLPGMPANHLRYPNLLGLLDVPDRRTGTLAVKDSYRDIVVAAKDRMIRVGRWKLTYHPLQSGVLYRLFDLERDPGCREDIAMTYPQLAAELQGRLAEWLWRDGGPRDN